LLLVQVILSIFVFWQVLLMKGNAIYTYHDRFPITLFECDFRATDLIHLLRQKLWEHKDSPAQQFALRYKFIV